MGPGRPRRKSSDVSPSSTPGRRHKAGRPQESNNHELSSDSGTTHNLSDSLSGAVVVPRADLQHRCASRSVPSTRPSTTGATGSSTAPSPALPSMSPRSIGSGAERASRPWTRHSSARYLIALTLTLPLTLTLTLDQALLCEVPNSRASKQEQTVPWEEGTPFKGSSPNQEEFP